MKEVFCLISCLFSLQAMAQIEIFDDNIQEIELAKVLPYDSLRNISTQRYGTSQQYEYTMHHLIGQILMYCGDPYEYHAKHSFETGSYYRVDSILPDDTESGLYHRLKLTNIQTGEQTEEGDIFTDKYNYKWVVVGHYEKIKSLYLNKEFVYVGTKNVYIRYNWEKANGMINLKADTVSRIIPEGSIWTCVGVQVKPRKKGDGMEIDKRSPIVLIFDNPSYGEHYCYLEDDSGQPYKPLIYDSKPLVCGRFQLKSYYDKMTAITAANKEKRKVELTKKYGTANANLILEGKVRIGMTKAMCAESWGYPNDINTSIGSWGIHEQWVYDNSYLYFEGDRLTSIQN